LRQQGARARARRTAERCRGPRLRANAPIFISLDLLASEGIVPEAAEEERLSLFRDFVNSLDGDESSPT